MEQAIITAVTHDLSEAKLTVNAVPDSPGIAARLFRALADQSVNVDMIVQDVSHDGTTDISFTTPTRTRRRRARAVANALAAEHRGRGRRRPTPTSGGCHSSAPA